MKKREFNKTINACRTRDKKRLDLEKVRALPEETKAGVTYYLVRNRGPILLDLLPAKMDMPHLRACGYLFTTKGATSGLTFLHTSEHAIR